jgi:hypothetical protein
MSRCEALRLERAQLDSPPIHSARKPVGDDMKLLAIGLGYEVAWDGV